MSKIKKLVVIGASAGGLDALHRMVENLEKRDDISYVVIQHQKPSHKSMLTELLSKYTSLPVCEIQDGDEPKAGINVAPSGKNVLFKEGRFSLENTGERWIPTPNIDYFLNSSIEHFHENMIAVILSGTGSDGTHGCKAVKGEGGVVIVQEPSTADYPGMPQSVLERAVVDFVLSPEKIGQEIVDIVDQKIKIDEEIQTDWYEKILKSVLKETGVDFSLYKENTIQRRLERRVVATKTGTLEKYYNYLQVHIEEAEALYKDILIGVTSFFRDSEPFLKFGEVLEKIIDSKKDGENLRIWTAGCSSGEEAYTVSMLIHEIILKKDRRLNVQIFATDIDEDSINQGRKGVYSPVTVEAISKDLRDKYIINGNGKVEVGKIIRESIVFSKHNMLVDPPFVKLDGIVCRNVLIYFNSELQKKILNTFYYSLNYEGVLFLGRSETVSQSDGGFEPSDEASKIYKKVHGKMNTSLDIFPRKGVNQTALTTAEAAIEKRKLREKRSFEDVVGETLFKFYPGSLLIIDSNNNVVFTKGELHPYVSFPQGEINNNLYKLLHETVNLEIRTLVHRAKEELDVVYSGILRNTEATFPPVQISVYPIKESGELKYYVICFAKKDPKEETHTLPTTEKEEYLEHELNATREYLQTVIEELETSNEELQSINEEFQASNEELQASNEELETSNEELQATNEELQSAYAELKMMYKEKEVNRRELLQSKEDLESVNEKLKVERLESSEKEHLISTIFDLTAIGICVTDEYGQFYKYNKAFTDIYGYSEREIKNLNFTDLFSEEMKVESNGSEDYLKQDLQIITKKGKTVDVSLTEKSVILDDDTKYRITTIDDITERKERENTLSLVAKVFENTTEGIVITDADQKILEINDAVPKITGFSKEELLGETPRIFKSNWHDEAFYQGMFQSLHETGSWEGEIWDRRKNGETYISWFLILAIRGESGLITNYIAISNEITEKKEQEEKIKKLAFFDNLTGLPNRALFFDRLNQAIERSQRRKNHLAIAFFDLDRFKNINDNYGHDIGDELLKSVSKRVLRIMRKEDTFARIGGDEFVLIFENVNKVSEIIPKLEQIREEIELPIIIKDLELFTTTSIGVSVYPEDSTSATELLKNADMAMYESKSKGKNRYNFFSKEMNITASRNMIIESGLRKAIEKGNFSLKYQPIYNIDDLSINGVEALIRWEHYELGFISPEEFIPVAEDTGLIIDIGKWVMEKATSDIKSVWEKTGKKFCLSLNISPIQLSKTNFSWCVDNACEMIDIEYLDLEVTETAIMDKTFNTLNILKEINQMGIKISIDDFGTGYSSLSYLKAIPHDRIKIDKSFVGDIEHDEDDRVIVKVIADLGKTMGSELVAEGVETKEQLEYLREIGCDLVQGYYMSKPVDLEVLIKMVENG
ncbi:MAG: EAL domain-containing protein [Campylobacterales bacterium]|nr:EAL domain-containing protein [Campylobacterales bacterium]